MERNDQNAPRTRDERKLATCSIRILLRYYNQYLGAFPDRSMKAQDIKFFKINGAGFDTKKRKLPGPCFPLLVLNMEIRALGERRASGRT
jgi:hypothetical protein